MTQIHVSFAAEGVSEDAHQNTEDERFLAPAGDIAPLARPTRMSANRRAGSAIGMSGGSQVEPFERRGMKGDQPLEETNPMSIADVEGHFMTPVAAFVPAQRTHTSSPDGIPALGPVAAPTTENPAATSLAKATLDRVLAGTALLVLLPLLLLVAVMVRVGSRGPAFYRQERVGLNGRTFMIWKFRSMVVDADAELQALLHQHDRHLIPLFKVPDDPRITRLGAVLRKTSLDELPQLFNVLRGEMSLVGPRPQRPAEVELYEPAHHARLAVRPGITGLWQINGRSDLPWQEAIQHDLRYVTEWSLLLDAEILLRTVAVVLKGRGAE